MKLGTFTVKQNGTALVVQLPGEWLATNNVKIGDPLFSVLTLDDCIRVHLEHVEWSKKASVRKIKSGGFLNINTAFATRLGIEKGTEVQMEADIDHHILIIRRAA